MIIKSYFGVFRCNWVVLPNIKRSKQVDLSGLKIRGGKA